MSRVLDALRTHARSGDAIALSDGQSRLTYSALSREVDAAADRLRTALGDRPGSCVGVELDNGLPWVVLDLALLKLGWCSVPIPPFFTPAQRDHALKRAGVALLVSDRPEGDGAPLEIAGRGLGLRETGARAAPTPEAAAKITFTSGSTGAPKGVRLSAPQMEAVAVSIVTALGAELAGVHLPVLPLSVLLENVAGLYASLIAGGRYHVLPARSLGLESPFRPDWRALVSAIVREQPTSLILVPELLRGLMAALDQTGLRLERLKLVAVGGAKVAPGLLDQAAALGLPVYEGYGLSECASVVALNSQGAVRRGSVGRVLPHVDVSIGDDGEILVGSRSDAGATFLGYAGGPEPAGKIGTGDLGRLDADGFLYVDGRKDNLIVNAFGRNLSPEWIESELLSQAAIGQALVFEDGGADLGALIVPSRPGLRPDEIAGAVADANGRLPDYAQVRRWKLRPPFDPNAGELTGNGRPRRAALLEAEGVRASTIWSGFTHEFL